MKLCCYHNIVQQLDKSKKSCCISLKSSTTFCMLNFPFFFYQEYKNKQHTEDACSSKIGLYIFTYQNLHGIGYEFISIYLDQKACCIFYYKSAQISMINVQCLFAKLLNHLLFFHNRNLFVFCVFGCWGLWFFSETKSRPTSQWVYRVTQENSRKMTEPKNPVRKKVQPSLALYLHNKCNFVLTAVSILENMSLTMIF